MLQKATVETTGFGDIFCACVLNYVLEHGWKHYTEEGIEEVPHKKYLNDYFRGYTGSSNSRGNDHRSVLFY